MYSLSEVLILHLCTYAPCEWLMLCFLTEDMPHLSDTEPARCPILRSSPSLKAQWLSADIKLTFSPFSYFLCFCYGALHSLIAFFFFPLQIRISEKMSQEINLGDRPHPIFRIPFPFRKLWL